MTDVRNDYELCMDRLRGAGQKHVLRWWDELNDASRCRLVEQINAVDFRLMNRLIEQFLRGENGKFQGSIEPCPVVRLPKTEEDFADRSRMQAAGIDAISRGETALLVAAGGQGSRLGYDAPKGVFPIAPITGKSLFRLFAEKVIATQRRYHTTIPFYIMTSTTNHDSTVEFFESNAFFGLDADNVMFFSQDMLPAVDFEGKLILKAKDELFWSPNGHGGTIKALSDSGALDDMQRRGVRFISYHQVDNALVKSIDPVFIGYHAARGADMSLKVLSKRDAEEKLGVVGYVDGRLSVIEYSDLDENLMHARRPDGSLVYDMGNIAIHIISVDFARRENEGGFRLPYHVAKKKIEYVDTSGRIVKPEKSNGIKFETFIFDAVRDADVAVVFESRREEEFAPVKNSDGEDSPATARQALANLFGAWLEDAGVKVNRDTEGNVTAMIEISPLFALDAERNWHAR